MAQLLIRRLDDAVHARLKERATAHGHSLEQEAREVLGAALARDDHRPREHLVDVAWELFGPDHGVQLELPRRTPARPGPDFSKR